MEIKDIEYKKIVINYHGVNGRHYANKDDKKKIEELASLIKSDAKEYLSGVKKILYMPNCIPSFGLPNYKKFFVKARVGFVILNNGNYQDLTTIDIRDRGYRLYSDDGDYVPIMATIVLWHKAKLKPEDDPYKFEGILHKRAYNLYRAGELPRKIDDVFICSTDKDYVHICNH